MVKYVKVWKLILINTIVLPLYPRYLTVKNGMKHCFLSNSTAVSFINIHCLTVGKFSFLQSTVTEYCAHRFLYFPEKEQ